MKEREKNLERKLDSSLKSIGGLCLKLPSIHISGLPDRMCLFPEGRILFVEVKSTGMKPRKIQKVIHDKLRKLGFDVEILDSTEKLNQIMKDYE